MRANQGPSSSGVRLQQAKSMLDKAAEVIGRLEAGTASGISTAEQQQASSSQDSVPDEQVCFYTQYLSSIVYFC